MGEAIEMILIACVASQSQHVYQNIWIPEEGEILLVEMKPTTINVQQQQQEIDFFRAFKKGTSGILAKTIYIYFWQGGNKNRHKTQVTDQPFYWDQEECKSLACLILKDF